MVPGFVKIQSVLVGLFHVTVTKSAKPVYIEEERKIHMNFLKLDLKLLAVPSGWWPSPHSSVGVGTGEQRRKPRDLEIG